MVLLVFRAHPRLLQCVVFGHDAALLETFIYLAFWSAYPALCSTLVDHSCYNTYFAVYIRGLSRWPPVIVQLSSCVLSSRVSPGVHQTLQQRFTENMTRGRVQDPHQIVIVALSKCPAISTSAVHVVCGGAVLTSTGVAPLLKTLEFERWVLVCAHVSAVVLSSWL